MSQENATPIRTTHDTCRVLPYTMPANRSNLSARLNHSRVASPAVNNPRTPLQPLSSHSSQEDISHGSSYGHKFSFFRDDSSGIFDSELSHPSPQTVTSLASAFKLSPHHREQAQAFNAVRKSFFICHLKLMYLLLVSNGHTRANDSFVHSRVGCTGTLRCNDRCH